MKVWVFTKTFDSSNRLALIDAGFDDDADIGGNDDAENKDQESQDWHQVAIIHLNGQLLGKEVFNRLL